MASIGCRSPSQLGVALLGVVLWGSSGGQYAPFSAKKLGADPAVRFRPVCRHPCGRDGLDNLFLGSLSDPQWKSTMI